MPLGGLPTTGRAPFAILSIPARVFSITGIGGGDGVDRRERTRARTGSYPGKDAPGRPLVALPPHHLRGVRVVHHLRDNPCLPGRALLLHAVPLAVLLAVPR